MSIVTGPSIVTSGLVLDFDIANTQKSWKGAATTNLVDPSWASWGTDGSGQGSIGTRTITDTYECTIVDSTANTRQSIYITSGISASTVYTFSVQYKKLYGTPTLRFQIQAYNGGTYLSTMSFATTAQLGITDIGDWQTAQITLTTPASTNRILWFMQDGDDYTTYTHSFSLKNVQCEQQSFATPFVVGTRSTTQAIVDLTGINTITANNVVYESNGTFSFNNGYISLPSLNLQRNFTLECWVKLTSVGTSVGFFGQGPTSNNQGLHIGWFPGRGLLFGMYANDLEGPAYSMTYNTWHHFVFTYDHSTYFRQTWADGVLVSSGTLNQYSGSGQFNIGSIYSSPVYNSFTGNFAIARAYSKVLTASEIKQNFDAHRGRYGV
jgi:hypothetical protein